MRTFASGDFPFTDIGTIGRGCFGDFLETWIMVPKKVTNYAKSFRNSSLAGIQHQKANLIFDGNWRPVHQH